MNPTFNNQSLTSLAAAESVGAPAVTTGRHRMPDVAGEYFQTAPPGSREIVVRGVLTSAVSTGADLAVRDLKLRIRLMQDNVGEVANYVGTDGTTWPECMLREYRQAGPVEVSSRPSGVEALVEVEAYIVAQP